MSKRLLFVALCAIFLKPAWGGGLYDQRPLSSLQKSPSADSELFGNPGREGAVMVDISSINSWDEVSDSSNETPSVDVASLAGMAAGSQVTITHVGWDLNLSVVGLSWFSEPVISMGDDLVPSLFLVPGEGDDFDSPNVMNYASNGLVALSSIGLPDLVLTDGVMEFEYYELFDDVADAVDATFEPNSFLTFGLPSIPSGDFDGNGSYECADVDLLTANIANGMNDPAFDLTGDGLVTRADLDAWLVEAGAAELPSGNAFLPADANLDGVVDGVDFQNWNDNKFTNNTAFCEGNFDANAVVDAADFLVWNDNKFTSSDAVAVPEPSSLATIFLGLACLLRRRR